MWFYGKAFTIFKQPRHARPHSAEKRPKLRLLETNEILDDLRRTESDIDRSSPFLTSSPELGLCADAKLKSLAPIQSEKDATHKTHKTISRTDAAHGNAKHSLFITAHLARRPQAMGRRLLLLLPRLLLLLLGHTVGSPVRSRVGPGAPVLCGSLGMLR